MMNFNVVTLGCKVNQYESQAMREDLIAHGYLPSDDRERRISPSSTAAP
jgi:threonylcarbamoyladenosine tRNA methylthiotransferase MtaB